MKRSPYREDEAMAQGSDDSSRTRGDAVGNRTPDLHIHRMTEPDLLPLTPGLVLVYNIKDEDGIGTLTIKVLSASEKAGGTKVQCLRTHTVNGADNTTTYTITRKHDGVYGPWGKEFPLPPAPGLTWVRNHNQQCAIDTLDAVVTVPAGTFQGCLRLQWDIDGGEGGKGERCYAPGIGLVYANSSESGDEREISLRQLPNSQAATTRLPESTSDFFPSDSHFPDNVIENVYMPPNTAIGDIEASAHVLNYTTPAGHYCELWWKGLDSGIPLLAYLVDDNGAHYLDRLSQPQENGKAKFATLEEARDIFTELAKVQYRE